jgi:LysM repeat protein
MIRFRRTLTILFLSSFLAARADAQSPRPALEASSESTELLTLSRKIDEQNTKIDLLSQQILRLQQEIQRPQAASALETAPRASEASSPLPAGSGNTHIVAKGETLTSIARQHKVTIEELQKFNHIENDRKLQIGQTLVIPGAPGASPSPAPSASVPNE